MMTNHNQYPTDIAACDMPLRDFFAAQIVSGMLANGTTRGAPALAKEAYLIADAMLLVRTAQEARQ